MNDNMLLKGLKSADVDILRAQFGFNDSTVIKPNILVTFFKHVFNLYTIFIFIISTVLFYFGLKTFGFILIALLVITTLINTIFQYINTSIICSSIANINRYSIVIRDGQQYTIPSRELVPQDVIYLTKGNIVPADVTIINTSSIEVHEKPNDNQIIKNTRFKGADLLNSTSIVDGSCYAQVNYIGKDKHTNIQGLKLKLNFNPITNIKTNIQLSKIIKSGTTLKNIDVIPKLKKLNILCLDKTGVLTKNNSTIENVIINNQKLYSYILKIPQTKANTTLDSSIIEYASKFASIRSVLNTGAYVDNVPFDSKSRLSGYKFQNGILYFGSPKEVMNKLVSDELFKLETISTIELEESKGLNSIGIGWSDSYDYSRSYLGTFLFKDEIKEDTKASINQLQELGVKVKLISSDSLLVCTKLAIDSNIAASHELCINANALNYKNELVLIEQVKFYNVFGRTNSDQKLAILNALSKSYSIGYLESNTNSLTDFNSVSVGISTDTTSDIVKSNSDLILKSSELSIITDIIKDSF
jgi:magnesium-transporting ATPase (P-type)